MSNVSHLVNIVGLLVCVSNVSHLVNLVGLLVCVSNASHLVNLVGVCEQCFTFGESCCIVGV